MDRWIAAAKHYNNKEGVSHESIWKLPRHQILETFLESPAGHAAMELLAATGTFIELGDQTYKHPGKSRSGGKLFPFTLIIDGDGLKLVKIARGVAFAVYTSSGGFGKELPPPRPVSTMVASKFLKKYGYSENDALWKIWNELDNLTEHVV